MKGYSKNRVVNQPASTTRQLIILFPHHLYIFPGGAFPFLVSQQGGGVVGDGQLCAAEVVELSPHAAEGLVFFKESRGGDFTEA